MVEGSVTCSGAGSSSRDLGLRGEEAMDDCEMNDNDETVEGARTRETEDLKNDDMLLGISTSTEDADDDNISTSISGGSGDSGSSDSRGCFRCSAQRDFIPML